MQEVYTGLFVGNQSDYEGYVSRQSGWAVVHACKEPYHRQVLGYSGRGAPKNHPEYLVALRGNRLILNIVDTSKPEFFDKEGMIDHSLDFIDEKRKQQLNILIHCNQGESRAPMLGLLYMAMRLHALPVESLEQAEEIFETLYPDYNPGPGIRGHIQQYWLQYYNDGLVNFRSW